VPRVAARQPPYLPAGAATVSGVVAAARCVTHGFTASARLPETFSRLLRFSVRLTSMKLHRNSTTLIAIIGLSLLLRGATYFCFLGTALPWFPEMATATDMHATWEWSDKILAGDILGRDTYHPEFGWMKEAGTAADWTQRWGDIHIFQQEPLYAYSIAVLRWLVPSPLHAIPLTQLLLGGILLPLAVYSLGRQIVGSRTSLYAAAIATLFGPEIFYQCALLRDWTIPIGSAFALALAIAGIRRSRLVWLLGAGLLFGIGAMMKSTALLWLPVCLCWLWFVPKKSTSRTRAAQGTAALLLGFALGLSPLIARNCIVGAPPLALSNRLPEGLIQGNAADAYPVELYYPPSQDATLRASGGSALKVAGEILRGYGESPGAFFRVQGMKLRAAFAPVDIADNLSYDYGTLRLPILRYCPSWGVLLALAIPGVLLLLLKRRSRSPWVAGILAANAIAILLPIALGRYRLEALPLLAIGAAQLLRLVIIELRRRTWNRLVLHIGAAAALALLLFWLWPPAWLRTNFRQSLQLMDRNIATDVFAHQRRFEKAADEADELSAKAAEFPAAERERIQALEDEITCLVFAMIDAARSGNPQLADKFLQRAHRGVNDGPSGRRFTEDEVAAFLAQRFPLPIAGQLAEILLTPAPAGTTP
jgi:hypothetical protein